MRFDGLSLGLSNNMKNNKMFHLLKDTDEDVYLKQLEIKPIAY